MKGELAQTDPAGPTLSPRGQSLLLALADAWGSAPGDVAVALGLADETLRSRAYASWRQKPYWSPKRASAHLSRAAAIAAARHRILLSPDGDGKTVAIIPAPSPRPNPAADYPNTAYTAPSEFDAALSGFWPAIVRDTTQRLSAERPRYSASYRRVGPQMVWFAIAVLFAMLGVLPWYVWPVTAANILLCGAFFAVAALRVAALMQPRLVSPPPISTRDLPPYTVLVPLYREANVVGQLVQHLRTLDYPLTKLDIRLLIEADDAETVAALRAEDLPPYFTVIAMPAVAPRTKPKALNAGLLGAWGDLVTIFDAEDLPDRDQLRRAAAHFAAADRRVACLQARLRIDNGGINMLTGFFALEYEALFRRFLPMLQRLRLPIPLGGTSNHVRRDVLDAIGGWDPYNVTEDADLGFRMIRFGFRVEVLDSDTWEEAPIAVWDWFHQRSRWYKGWIQTWIVHMRHPFTYLSQTGWRGFIGLQLLMGGMFLSAIAHPILLATALLWVLGYASPPVGTGFMVGLNVTCLVIGHGAMMALCWLSAGDGPQHRRRFALVPLLPLYMLLHTAAALRAIYQYLKDPYHWAKTRHGRSRRENLRRR